MITGERIKKLRKNLGLTQAALSEKSGVHINSIKFYESGRYEPTLFNACCLAKALGVTLDYLAGISDEK